MTLILTRVDATIFNEMHEFWRKRRPDITLLILSSKDEYHSADVGRLSIEVAAVGVESRVVQVGITQFWVGFVYRHAVVRQSQRVRIRTKVAKEGENGGNKDVSYHYYTGMAAESLVRTSTRSKVRRC